MLTKNKNSFFLYASILLGCLILFNLIGRNLYRRFDLTDNKMYSLSSSSKNVVAKIEDLLIMKVYFSEDLPNELGNTKRYLQDILEEYAAHSNDNLRFYFTVPESSEDLENEARKDGIQPVQMQVVENDKLEIKRVYLGIALFYEDKKEIIPVIQTTTGLEYLITTKIKTLVDTDKKTIGLANLDSNNEIKTQNLSSQLSQHYNVRNTDVATPVDDKIDVLLVSGTSDTLDSLIASNIDSFLESGRGVLFTQSGVHTDIALQQANAIQSDVFSFLRSYGFILKNNLVLDRSCGRVQVQQQMGFFRMNVPMEYPFLPIVQSFNENELIVNGLEQVHLFFPSEIQVDTVLSDKVVDVVDLFSSSNNSGIMEGRFMLNPDPKNNPFLRNLDQSGKLLCASSKLTSGGELILVSDSRFLSDDGGMSIPVNLVFLMNAVDYLSGDKELISLRSREVTDRPLKKLEDGSRKRWKWANILLPSIIIVGLGFIRIRQGNKRADILKQIYE